MDFRGSIWALASAVVSSYLLGSFSGSIFLSKTFRGVDVRDYFSGNAGATNAMRVMGPGLGKWVYVIDFLKSAFAVALSIWLYGRSGGYLGALSCILGHMWPLYYSFRGGKGVLSAFASILFLDWRIAIIGGCVFLILLFVFKYVSLASMMMIGVFALITGIFRSFSSVEFIVAFIIFALIVYRHRGNIQRIAAGTERKAFQKKDGGGENE